MNEISDGAIMAASGRQMTAAVAKQVVAAGNLANIDTPGYRTRDASLAISSTAKSRSSGLRRHTRNSVARRGVG
jgi:flagellar basal body rod protein FlgB